MAETIYFSDGTHEVVLTADLDEKRTIFERLIREKLGDEAARFFLNLFFEVDQYADSLSKSVSEHERAADGYSALCHDAVDQFRHILNLLDAPKLNKSALYQAAKRGYDDLYNNL